MSIPRSVAVLAPRHMRAPLMSMPMKFLSGLRSARATVYSPLPAAEFENYRFVVMKKIAVPVPLQRVVATEHLSELRLHEAGESQILRKTFEFIFSHYSFSIFIPTASTPRTGCTGRIVNRYQPL